MGATGIVDQLVAGQPGGRIDDCIFDVAGYNDALITVLILGLITD